MNGGSVDRPRQPRPNRRTQRWLDTEESEDRYGGRNDTVRKKNDRSRVTKASFFIWTRCSNCLTKATLPYPFESYRTV